MLTGAGAHSCQIGKNSHIPVVVFLFLFYFFHAFQSDIIREAMRPAEVFRKNVVNRMNSGCQLHFDVCIFWRPKKQMHHLSREMYHLGKEMHHLSK